MQPPVVYQHYRASHLGEALSDVLEDMEEEGAITAELAALLYFYAESGVDELCEDAAIDRFEQSAKILQSRSRPQPRTAWPPKRPAPR